uniref:Reelin domain-containing protein n=1 Tax=Knipowitschia caucasica TaxID=637954 RepID=A0AAV2KMN9_KNICA
MGFLLQARTAERPGLSSRIQGEDAAVQSRPGAGGLGGILLGGSWTLTPPGTHTVRCFSDEDTVTHSDKQPKRNLSFVWRAPDRSIGDVRFYLTVVQSYFVYWTGISSRVLHDGTRGRWRGNSMRQDRGGKYPDIIPRHSAWELGMLLGCSAGLGMILVVGIKYVHRKACGKRTQVTLHDREREYGRGDRGLIHVQECGDLVRVRRIRENSFVLLAEYDILATPGD